MTDKPDAKLSPETLRAMKDSANCPNWGLRANGVYGPCYRYDCPCCGLDDHADAWASELARREAMAKLLREACWVAYEGANFLMCRWCDVTAEDGKGQDYLDAIPHAPDCPMAALASREKPT